MTISYKNALLLVGLSVSAINLSACDYMSKNYYHVKTPKTTIEPPTLDIPTVSGDITQEAVSHLHAENVFNEKPAILIEKLATDAPLIAKTDLNVEKMPAIPVAPAIETAMTPVNNAPVQLALNEKRFNDLEARVEKITNTLNQLSPAIIKIAGIESDLDSLTLQLAELIEQNKNTRTAHTVPSVSQRVATPESDTIRPVAKQLAPYKISRSVPDTQIEQKIANQTLVAKPPIEDTPSEKIKIINASSKVQEAPALQEEKENIVATIEPAAGNSLQQVTENLVTSATNTVYKIRSGDHKGRTRLVFETSQKLSSPDIQIDNDEKIVLINLGAVDFSQALQGNVNKLIHTSSLIHSAYDLKNKTNQQTALVLDLTKETELISSNYIAPGKESKNHRLVIDIKR